MKFRLVLMALFLALVAPLATTASAQSEFDVAVGNMRDVVTSPFRQLGSSLCENHRGTGDATEYRWCYDPANPNSEVSQQRRGYYPGGTYRDHRYSGDPSYHNMDYDQYGRRIGDRYGYGSQYGRRYDDRYRGDYRGTLYDRDVHGRDALEAGVSLGIAWLQTRGDRQRGEDPSKCFERVVKQARKERVEITSAEAMAFCSGQPMQAPPPEYNPREGRTPEPPSARGQSRGGESFEVWVNQTNCDFRVRDIGDPDWTEIQQGKAVRVEDPRTADYQTQCESGEVKFIQQTRNTIVLRCAQ